MELGLTLLPAELPAAQLALLARQPWRERSVAEYYRARTGRRRDGYYADNYGEAYLLYRPDFGRRVAYLRANDAGSLAAEMEAAGVRDFYTIPGTVERVAIIREAQRLRAASHLQEGPTRAVPTSTTASIPGGRTAESGQGRRLWSHASCCLTHYLAAPWRVRRQDAVIEL